MNELSEVERVVIDMMRSGKFELKLTALNPYLSNAEARQLIAPFAAAVGEKATHHKLKGHGWWKLEHEGSPNVETVCYLKQGPWEKHDGD